MPGPIIHRTENNPIYAWTDGVAVEESAQKQINNIAKLPIVFKHVAIMPDCHFGIGATVGSVIPTRGAVIPAAVGVDIGCGMVAQQLSLTADDLPFDLKKIRSAIESSVPHGRTNNGGRGDRGAWSTPPVIAAYQWETLLANDFKKIVDKHPKIGGGNDLAHLSTLGTGNHFIEVCLDKDNNVWVMLHSGSRGVGNRIGTYFITKAKEDMASVLGALPDEDLAYLTEGTQYFDDYVEAVSWAQKYARINRDLMMSATIDAIRGQIEKPFTLGATAVNCHHNYVSREHHFGEDVLVTRKGAVSAKLGELGVIPGSMGTRSYIVRGLGNPESFCSCSHGAGRAMSRNEAKRRFTVADHTAAMVGIEARLDEAVVDETPMAYKPIDKVMAAQSDLVEIVHELRQVLVVKG